MQVDLTALKTAVAAERDATAAAIKLIQGIAAKLAELGAQPTVDPAQLQELADQLTTDSATLGKAVTDNTPVALPA